MDIERLLGAVIGGAVGRQGKRHRGAGRVLGGSLLTPTAILGAAGVAWGLYETWKNQQGAPPAPAGPPPLPGAEPTAASPPPLPGVPAVPTPALRLVRVALAAARADGSLSGPEAERILEQARAVGAEQLVHEELQAARSLADITAGITDPEERAALYVVAFTIVHGDEGVSGSERLFLGQLASQLGLDPALVRQIEQQTAERIAAAANH